MSMDRGNYSHIITEQGDLGLGTMPINVTEGDNCNSGEPEKEKKDRCGKCTECGKRR